MRNIFAGALIVFVVSASACTLGIFDGVGLTGSGVIAERNISAGDFDAVTTGFGMTVNITEGPACTVILRCDDNIIDRIRYELSGNTLRFYIEPSIWSVRTHKLEADITMPMLTGLSLSGGARGIIAMAARPETLTVSLSGGSNAQGGISPYNGDFHLSGGSSAYFRGTCESLAADGGGGSIFELREFVTSNGNVTLSGGSRMDISVNVSLDAGLSGGSRLTYYGSGSINRADTSGGSVIRKGNN